MRGRPHRDQIATGIEPGFPAQGCDRGEAVGEALPQGGARIEEHRLSRCELRKDRARHDVPRRKLRSRDVGHEPLAPAIDEHGAFAAHRLGRKRHRIGAGRDRGGVKLDEFEIAQNGAGAGGKG